MTSRGRTGQTALPLRAYISPKRRCFVFEESLVKLMFFAVSVCLLAVAASAQDCRQVLGQQSADAASIKQVEHAWTEAFLHGGTQYLDCLLTRDYVSVSA